MEKLPRFGDPLGFSQEEAVPLLVILLYSINESRACIHSLENFYLDCISSAPYRRVKGYKTLLSFSIGGKAYVHDSTFYLVMAAIYTWQEESSLRSRSLNLKMTKKQASAAQLNTSPA